MPIVRVVIRSLLVAALAVVLTPRPPQSVAADNSWWSLRPLTSPRVPRPADPGWLRTPVDAFIARTLQRHRLTASDAASRGTLIRRVTIDLTGLPPDPAAVKRFLADRSADAYERLVEELLHSPRYGERWARHWLDLVHYGDTHGYDKDKPRPNAWPYRDYVVRAFNKDTPFRRFVEEQIAGDVLYPDTTEGIVATGFLAAGPWDFIGHAEVPETKLDGQVARNLDRDDMVRTVMNTFISLTVECARCHDHKFDDITQEDYYSLQAVFGAIDRADRTYDPDPTAAARRRQLDQELGHLQEQRQQLDRELNARGGKQLAEIRKQLQGLGRTDDAKPRAPFGYHSRIMPADDSVKWVQVDLGSSRKLAHVVIVGCHDDFNNIGDGFGFPPRFRIDISDDREFRSGVTCLWDQTGASFPNPGIRPLSVPADNRSARFIRVTATRLAARSNDYIFALAELAALDPQGNNLAAGRTVTSLDSIEAPPRWRRANLVDGYYDRVRAVPRILSRIVALNAKWSRLRKTLLTPEWLRKQSTLQRQLRQVRAALAAIPAPALVYAGTIHTGSGAFRGTGHDNGRPRPIHVLTRGDIRHKGAKVGPGTIAVTDSLPSRFRLAADHNEGERRKALAGWIVDRRNPLTWRSIVNRIWQFHIGRPLVASPNDFGRMGEEPTHPELLDWLAARLRDGNGSLKDLHRQILLSATYRQVSRTRREAARIDGDNRFLWRMNRRRVEAEVVRDSVLAISGKLNGRMYGRGFQDFVVEKPQHSPHYQYHKHDPNDARTHRRSIYRFLVRSQQQPFMTTLDCADPSRLVARRDETISPLQALAMLNNRFMTTMAGHFAARLVNEQPRVEGRVRRAVELAFSRPATTEEVVLLSAYTDRHGLANTCRLILNLNEFVFVN